MKERFELLAEMPVFGGLNKASLDLITEQTGVVRTEKGQHFFHEGDQSKAMYVLQLGQVDIYKTWKTETKHLKYMHRGDCFGEMALVDFSARSASALAIVDSEALEITPQILHLLHQQDSEQFTLLHMNMGREISRRLRLIDDQLFRALMGEDLPETSFRDLTH